MNCIRIAAVAVLLSGCVCAFAPASHAQETRANVCLVLPVGSGSLNSPPMPVRSIPGVPYLKPPTQLSPNELANLVAPIALYPDPLLSQALVASTYPLEVVEVQQWLQQNGNLYNRELMEAAKQQDWDPSIQAMVGFRDVVMLLNRNIRWTTALGNAFLAQQSDVMNAIQSLRTQARRNGQLVSTPQLSVNTEMQGDQSAIEIQPSDPQTMYVPFYNPSAVWGVPAEGLYPTLPYNGSSWQSLIGTVVNLAGLLPGFSGLLGWKSWGWALSWLAHTLFVNNSFFSDFGFHNFNGDFGESSLWVHNAAHRSGVPYASSLVASLYGGGGLPARITNHFGQGVSEWQGFRSGAKVISATQPGRRFAPYASSGSESFPRDNRTARWDNWRALNNGTRMATAGPSGRAFSQPTWGTNGGLQPNHSVDRASYFANSIDSRASTFTASSSLPSNYDRFADSSNSRRPTPSRTVSSSSFWGKPPHFSPSRMFTQHGSSSQHFSKPKHFSAPKFSGPHSSKSHGGGHSSREYSGKQSHRK